MLSIFYFPEKIQLNIFLLKIQSFLCFKILCTHHQNWETVNSSLPIALFNLSVKDPSPYSCLPQKAGAPSFPRQLLHKQLLSVLQPFTSCTPIFASSDYLCRLGISTDWYF